MSRYFFDVHDAGKVQKDGVGTEFSSMDEVRSEAMRFLPDLAREQIPKDGDYRSLVVLVRDESGQAVYSATLNFTGLWLVDRR